MKHGEVLRMRAGLVAELPAASEILRGSLLRRKIRHSRGCPKCDRGGGHPLWVLTVSYRGGTMKQFSIRPEQKAQVERWLRNYRRLKGRLEAICELNHELLRREG